MDVSLFPKWQGQSQIRIPELDGSTLVLATDRPTLFGVSLKTARITWLFFIQAEDGIRDRNVTGVQTCALPISLLHTYTHAQQMHTHRDTRTDILVKERSEERRVGKSVDLGGRRIIKKKKK